MDDLGKKLNITNQEGWYQTTFDTIKQYGGSSILKHYNHSPSKLLMAVYPEYHKLC